MNTSHALHISNSAPPEVDESIAIRPVGEAAFTIEFGNSIHIALNHKVHALDTTLHAHPIPGIIETVPTYRALLVMYDPTITKAKDMRAALTHTLNQMENAPLPEGRYIEIPVRYGNEWGPDLADVAAHCDLSPDEVIQQHISPTYQVAMLGFAPGFAYLLGLPPTLATPRLPTPRLHVPPGSIGIAGEQTGLYALETPGGWRIIGRTTRRLFDPTQQDPFTLHAGDRVKFIHYSPH